MKEKDTLEIEKTVSTILENTAQVNIINNQIATCESLIRECEVREKKIRRIRYVCSEIYIFSWLGLSIFMFKYDQMIVLPWGYLLLLRVMEILNKELGAVLFGITKITKTPKNSSTIHISNIARVIILAFTNYVTVGFLFALLYLKTHNHFSGEATVRNIFLPFNAGTVLSTPSNSLVESFSILFSFSPAYTPTTVGTGLITLSESAFCFVFAALIITTFVSTITMKPTMK